jgi:hypothetical protein
MVHPSPVIKLDNALQMCFLEREFKLLCITVAYQTTYKKDVISSLLLYLFKG